MDKSASIEFAPQSLRQEGFTLVELMVGLVIASILAIVMLTVLVFSFNSSKSSADVTSDNSNMRTVLTLLTRDVGSAGFMVGNAQSACAITLAYDSAANPQYIQYNTAWAANQINGSTLPLGGAAATAENYPPPSSANVSQVLMMTEAPSFPGYAGIPPSGGAPSRQLPSQIPTVPFGNWTGAMASTTLIVHPARNNANTGDTGFIHVPMSSGTVCLRIPITSVSANSITSLPSTYMPGGGYTDFATELTSLGLTGLGALTVSNLQRASIVDLGSSPGTLQAIQYWIDGSGSFPVLMRGVYNALNDQPVGQPEAIAPGVVSLQVLFGTVPVGSSPGTTPTFKSWSQVAPGTDQVISVAIAVVSRSLHNDSTYTAPTIITVPQPAAGLVAPNAFMNYTRSASEIHRHFEVSTVLIALRNATWN